MAHDLNGDASYQGEMRRRADEKVKRYETLLGEITKNLNDRWFDGVDPRDAVASAERCIVRFREMEMLHHDQDRAIWLLKGGS